MKHGIASGKLKVRRSNKGSTPCASCGRPIRRGTDYVLRGGKPLHASCSDA